MSYKVIKWIKGNPYLYSQRTYRVGDRVYTQSKYIGRAGEREVAKYSRRTIGADTPQAKSPAHERIGKISDGDESEVNTTKIDRKFKKKINLKRFSISESALVKEREDFIWQMEPNLLSIFGYAHRKTVAGKDIGGTSF